jgi:hypothetical protein
MTGRSCVRTENRTDILITHDRPVRTMAKPYVDIGALPRLLVRPRKTFEDLRPHTGPLQGAMVALVLIVVAGLVDALVRWLFTTVLGRDLHVVGLAGRFPTFVAVLVAFIMFLLMAGLSYRFTVSWGRAKHPDAGMTVGLMGYAMFPVIIIGIAMSVLMTYFGGQVAAFLEGTGTRLEDWGGWGQYWLVYWLFVLVMLLWGIRVQAKAARVANDSAGMRTMGAVAAAWVVSIVLWVVIVQLWSLVTEGEWVDLPWLPFI